MTSDRMTAILVIVGAENPRVRGAQPVSAGSVAAAVVLGVDGITAGVGTGPEGVVLDWGEEEVGVALDCLEFTVGQGPGLAAVATGSPVLVPDLLDAAARWPAFTPGATELKVRAVFAFPLRIGAISVGALVAHRAGPGPLGSGQLVDALALAEAVTLVLLHRQGPPANLQPEAWGRPETYRAEVHQATGIISVQLGVGLAEALLRLRAYAYGNDRPIALVAGDVVAHRLQSDALL